MKQLRQTKPIKSHLQCPKFKDNNFPQLRMHSIKQYQSAGDGNSPLGFFLCRIEDD